VWLRIKTKETVSRGQSSRGEDLVVYGNVWAGMGWEAVGFEEREKSKILSLS
jgi:hypothetical protein